MHIEEVLREEARRHREKDKQGERSWRIKELALFILAGVITAVVAAMIERGTWLGSRRPQQPPTVINNPVIERIIEVPVIVTPSPSPVVATPEQSMK